MKHSEPLILNKEEFFEGFDNPSLQEKVVGIKIALLQDDNGEIGLGLGIEAPPLHSREIEEIRLTTYVQYGRQLPKSSRVEVKVGIPLQAV